MEWIYTVSGLVVGFIVGVTGVGGGSLMTPLLVLVFGISPVTAVGTDLIYASITKAGGAWVQHRSGNVAWKVVGRLALGSIPASLLTTAALSTLDLESKHLSKLIGTVLGVALILTALAVLFREWVSRFRRSHLKTGIAEESAYLFPATVGTGVVLGVLVTISSVGAGAIGMVVLLWLYSRYSSVKLVGTDIAHAVPLTAVAGLGHLYMGSVDFALLASLLLGSLPGIYLGSRVGSKFPDYVLRPTLACMLILIGGRLVW